MTCAPTDGSCRSRVLAPRYDALLADLRPSRPRDTRELGNQHAVYATPDPHWAMCFALVDRSDAPMLLNGWRSALGRGRGGIGATYGSPIRRGR